MEESSERKSKWKKHWLNLINLILMVSAIALCQWLFERWFDIVYWRWYLKVGAGLSTVFAIYSAVWGDINKRVSLISAMPAEYVGEYFAVFGGVAASMAHAGKSPFTKSAMRLASYGWVIKTINVVVGFPLIAGLVLGIIAWFIVIVPIQYFLFLICGAPGRLLLESDKNAIVPEDSGFFDIKYIDVDKPAPHGWQIITLIDKPVTLTAAISGLVLWVANGILFPAPDSAVFNIYHVIHRYWTSV